eukprot:TRINITY_DN58424_c0_g2_i2.p2 TRINITY_DN58424_c0_g2~~TRINITY_DN58424_c0_g2_i2.p2  ORF type:complete len:122 (-),score=26.60 TRINITY_DN58424_c0_g2_i2:51-416(-)
MQPPNNSIIQFLMQNPPNKKLKDEPWWDAELYLDVCTGTATPDFTDWVHETLEATLTTLTGDDECDDATSDKVDQLLSFLNNGYYKDGLMRWLKGHPNKSPSVGELEQAIKRLECGEPAEK